MDNSLNRELNQEEQKLALEIARKTIEAVFTGQKYQPNTDQYLIFQTKRGVFVTLHEDEKLRGCIGTFEPAKPLAGAIQEMASSAAFHDSRFYPLDEKELDQLKIEISILSPMEKIDDPSVIEVGKHGVLVKKGLRNGVYLPQVATEQNWDCERFLCHLCEHKAGIHKDSWKDGSADVYIFTAQVIKE